MDFFAIKRNKDKENSFFYFSYFKKLNDVKNILRFI
jgi:hypothetical protein